MLHNDPPDFHIYLCNRESTSENLAETEVVGFHVK